LATYVILGFAQVDNLRYSEFSKRLSCLLLKPLAGIHRGRRKTIDGAIGLG